MTEAVSEKTSDDHKFLNVRVPGRLHDRITALAERNDRTIAAEVRRALRELLVREETP